MTAQTLPTSRALAEIAAEIALAAQVAEDKRNMNALNKAAYHLASGIRIVESAGDLLIPSATTAGQVYRVSRRGCTCEAGLKGVACWHQAIVEVVTTAREFGGEAEGTPAGPQCCGVPMLRDAQTQWCPKCKFWQFL